MHARLDDSVLVVIDVQPTFLASIWEKERLLHRCRFLVECAKALDVPILATEQVPDKMGGTEPTLLELLPERPIGKVTFSAFGEKEFRKAWKKLDRTQAVIVGMETHICVRQSANDLLDDEHDVMLAVDAVSARTEAMHHAGVQSLRDEGVAVVHSESVVYEWMQTAEHDAFRTVLEIVKRYAG